MLLVLQCLLLLAVTRSAVEALVCRCDDCANGDTCDAGNGGRCYILTLNFLNMPKRTRRRCYEASSTSLCGTNTGQLVVHCCNTDRCNDVEEPIVDSPSQYTTTLSPSQTAVSSTTAATILAPVPTPPQHGITTSTLAPSQTVSSSSSRSTTVTPMPRTVGSGENQTTTQQEYQCVHHHSSWPQIKTQCRTNTSCYWRVRRKTNEEVIFQQGCSTPNKPCEQSLRNREAIFCCTGNLCNDVESPVASTKPTPTCTTTTTTTTTPSPTDDLIEQTVIDDELKLPSISITPTIATRSSSDGPVKPCVLSLVPVVITVTMTVTTTTTAESSNTLTENPLTAASTAPVPPSNVEEELCLAVTGLGVGFLFTSVISSLIACVCMRLFYYKCQKYHHHHPCNKT